MLTKARADKRDPLLALLEWRNTPTEGMNASPVQLLYGRQTCTYLPVTKQLSTSQVITDVHEKINLNTTCFQIKYHCIFLGNPVGCLVANVLAPVIVNHSSDIPFMVCSLVAVDMFFHK